MVIVGGTAMQQEIRSFVRSAAKLYLMVSKSWDLAASEFKLSMTALRVW